jgi:hypothetical protein
MEREMSSVSFLTRLDNESVFSNRAQFRFCIGLGAAFAIASIFLIAGYAFYSYTWTKIAGTVTSTEWKQHVKSSRNGSRTIRSVTFTYVGQSKHGTVVEGRNIINDVGDLKIVVGQQVEVLHDPEDPHSSMSIHELNNILKFALMTGLMAVFCSLFAQRYRGSGR